MIKYAQSQNVYISISTNGHFVNKNNVNLVVENAPDKLIFSVDGLNEESYQKYRVGGTFAQADEGLRLLIKRKKELGKKRPFIEFQFIVMKQNEDQLDEVVGPQQLALGHDHQVAIAQCAEVCAGVHASECGITILAAHLATVD